MPLAKRELHPTIESLIFRELIVDANFWGFGDIDLLYGDLRSFLSDELLSHDLITFNKRHISGHFTLLRNTPSVITSYKQSMSWREAIINKGHKGLDESNGDYGITNSHFEESFNTPLSPFIPWTDGSFNFPAIWYYDRGKLFNNINGDRRFMYLHFMRYKSRWKRSAALAKADLERLAEIGCWQLRDNGIFGWNGNHSAIDRTATLSAQTNQNGSL